MSVRETPDTQAATLEKGQFAIGAAWAFFAVSIWAGWFVVTRLGLIGSELNLYDITAIRFATAAVLLLPIVMRHGGVARSVGWGGTALMASGSGAPYALIAGLGLTFAPAAHAGPLTPGTMPLFAAGLSAIVLGERIARSRVIGLLLVPVGVALIVSARPSGHDGQATVWVGDLLFVTAALFWATYTVTLRRAKLPALQGAAIVAVWSAASYLPIYILFLPKEIGHASWRAIGEQVLFQGILSSVVSLIAYNRAVGILNASRTAVFASLVPAMAALLGIPILHETPGVAEAVGLLVVSLGVLLGSGAIQVHTFIGFAGRRN